MKLDKGNSVLEVLLDLSKALDTLSHEILMHDLQYYGIRELSNQWAKSYFEDCTQVTNTLSSPSNVSVGVPQGYVLGPLLFLMYVKDTCVSAKVLMQNKFVCC